jgi:hypothetical protein
MPEAKKSCARYSRYTRFKDHKEQRFQSSNHGSKMANDMLRFPDQGGVESELQYILHH